MGLRLYSMGKDIEKQKARALNAEQSYAAQVEVVKALKKYDSNRSEFNEMVQRIVNASSPSELHELRREMLGQADD